eukprot:12216106-Ditylum_brightwellii.AAC.1
MADRTISTIALGPSMNLQDGVRIRVDAMAEAEGHDRTIVFTNRSREEIADILPADQYEDWPKEANLTGVTLQCAQDKQTTIAAYTVDPEEDNDSQHAAPDK